MLQQRGPFRRSLQAENLLYKIRRSLQAENLLYKIRRSLQAENLLYKIRMNQNRKSTKTVIIPQGAFIMGTDIEPFYGTALLNAEHAKLDEAPMHVRFLKAYAIEQYPVSNAEYAAFVQATKHPPPTHWKNGQFADEDADLPIVHVSWHDSNAYAQWAGKRLPTEAEWEKASRGPDGRIYPWGNTFVPEEPESTDTSQILTTHLTPIGTRPATTSPYGIGETVGNVWEWTADWYQPYPDLKHKTPQQATDGKHKTLRGGSWLEAREGTAERYFRCANRLHAPPDYKARNIGFRCARETPPEQAEAVHVPVEPLVDYVKQKKLANLRLLQKRAEKNSLKDTLIAILLIGGATYYVIIDADLVLAGTIVGIIGSGFLFSASVNFWRRWRAGQRAKQVDSENFSPLLSED